MDPPSSMVKSFKYSSTQQQPLFSVLEPPLHYRVSPSPPSPHNNNNHNNNNNSGFQEASFSSYIKSDDQKKSTRENGGEDTEISIFDAQKYFSENSVDAKEMMKKQAAAAVVAHDVMSVPPRLSSVSSVDGYGRNYRTRSFHATPTASSEASWNSQTGLLANPPGSVGVSLRNFVSGEGKRRSAAARRWSFGRKCCCTGKKSVQVKEATTSDSEYGGVVIGAAENHLSSVKSNYLYAKRDFHKSKQSCSMSQRSSMSNDVVEIKAMAESGFPSADLPRDPPRQQRISASGRPFVDGAGGFSFPVLNNSAQVAKPPLKAIITKPVIIGLEDPPRDSLEVFQPVHEAPPPPTRFNPGSRGSPVARVMNTDDDVVSDASSDLFEIESFSTQTTSYPMYRRRDSLDEAPTFNVRRFASANGINLNGANGGNIQYGRRSIDEPPTPSVAATECYAPSEVSIDWSVTTAEGFERASVSNFSVSASEIGSAALLRQRMQVQEEAAAATAAGGLDGGRKKGNGGLLLMSCRQEKAVSVGPQPVKCVAAADGGSMFATAQVVGGRPPRASKPPLGSDHSARLSVAFAA